MGSKLANIVAYAANVVCPANLCNDVSACCAVAGSSCAGLSGCLYAPNADLSAISGTETAAGVILAVFLFLLMLSAISYVLSICSVGETLMFIIFKKKSDDDNILERKDEDELEEEEKENDDDFSTDNKASDDDNDTAAEEPTTD